jgi:hypothetical protein
MWRQEILELLEAIHPRIDIGGGGFDVGPDVNYIADMSTRPEPTTGVTSSQIYKLRGRSDRAIASKSNLQSRIAALGSSGVTKLILSPSNGPDAIIFHMPMDNGSRSFRRYSRLQITHTSRTCRLLVRLDECNGSCLEGSNADRHSPKGPSRMSST